MIRLAASFITGIWAVPPAMSRVPSRLAKRSKSPARAGALHNSKARAANNKETPFLLITVFSPPCFQICAG